MNKHITIRLPIEHYMLVLNSAIVVMASYLAAIAAAEALGVLVGVISGALCHAILIPTLLSHYVIMSQASYRRLLPALALAPLLRILSLTMPIAEVPPLLWYALVGAPLLVAMALIARLLNLSWPSLGLRVPSWRPQVLIALSGLPLSVVAFLILLPEPLFAAFNWGNLLISAVILFIFTGFTEEIMYRGLLQHVAVEIFGRRGILYSSALFAIMYAGSLSLNYMLFMALVGLFFSWCVMRTGSIWGVVLAHSVLNIALACVWPFFW